MEGQLPGECSNGNVYFSYSMALYRTRHVSNVAPEQREASEPQMSLDHIIVRAKELTRPEPVNLEALDKLGDKVVRIFETKIEGLVGETKLERLLLSKEFEGSKELKIDALFVEIGAKPDVEVPKSLGVELDKFGYIAVNNLMETNIAGIYAAGDTANHFGPFKQTITAAALGAVAATSAYNYHKIHGNLCQIHWKPAQSQLDDSV